METKAPIIETLRDLWSNPDVQETDELRRNLGIDSLGMVSLLLDLEDTFHFELDESDMNPFDLITVADVIRLVERYTGGEENG
jgi:acyl carrier protein